MKKLRIVSFFLLLTGLSLAQQFKPYKTFDLETELQKFITSGGKIEKYSFELYKLTYPSREIRFFNFGNKQDKSENEEPLDTTIINMWEIDTTKYYNKFTFWQKVEINNANFYNPPFVDDLNRNGKPEIYGRHHTDVDNWGPVEIYERNEMGKFESIYTYPDSGTWAVQAMGEIHGTGEKEVYLDHQGYENGYGVIYKSDSIGVLPTNFDFNFYYIPIGQINYITFGDFDKDGITDAAFIADFSSIVISEYTNILNNFSTIFEHEFIDDALSGFVVGDFDNDTKIELFAGSGNGQIYSIEAINRNLFQIEWEGEFSTCNAYMKTVTNDIDGNGKPEFWIGGQNFVEGITRFQCYESNGANSYGVVAVIELRYINTLNSAYLQTVEMDGDGKEELVIDIGNVILILKFTGLPNKHKYDIYYAKLGEITQPGLGFEPVAIADFNGDEKPDVLIPFFDSEHVLNFSYILNQYNPSRVKNYKLDILSLKDNITSYPVPFNSSTSIKFNVSEYSSVNIKIFNSLGKEINTIFNKELSPGEYNIQWDAKDKYGCPLPSGIYFICLETGNVIKTTKTILLK